jgi:hypothetical protein
VIEIDASIEDFFKQKQILRGIERERADNPRE